MAGRDQQQYRSLSCSFVSPAFLCAAPRYNAARGHHSRRP
jgi:hypothetical protein